uniref:RRM domain-containing protein n=1 Tax=Chromera velia CCMP2878 TaxID=1169474 RepID=A0A0G4HZK5_9ALVE|eukprot:Cvel_9750.t1-p1 / transcript=Cvel_9750.t1 / gene=Cvel_9750 / organism=Chromera_velia_CCMP2878 / gene_product=CUGBP Elav-like family member 6, putative / transcript_product=CUGBP Elav-like family member 6, putative / location=Cvel_scaffold570:39864-42027(+) / protein_length=573 / sequence_SO=supercontig / SO=protein_coding / is_pseudo=false
MEHPENEFDVISKLALSSAWSAVVPDCSCVSAEGVVLPPNEEAVCSEADEILLLEGLGDTIEQDETLSKEMLEGSTHCACCICTNGPLPWEADPNWRPARVAETLDAVKQLAPQVDASEMSYELQGFPYCPNQWGQAGDAELPQTIPKGKFGTLGTNLFAYGLPLGWNREKLINHFRDCGAIVSCRVVKDSKTKKSRGYGFVCFHDHKSTLKALQRLNGLEIGSGAFRKRLRVTIKLGEEKFFLAGMRECDRAEKEKVADLAVDAAGNGCDTEEVVKKRKRRRVKKKAAEKKKTAIGQEKEEEEETNNPVLSPSTVLCPASNTPFSFGALPAPSAAAAAETGTWKGKFKHHEGQLADCSPSGDSRGSTLVPLQAVETGESVSLLSRSRSAGCPSSDGGSSQQHNTKVKVEELQEEGAEGQKTFVAEVGPCSAAVGGDRRVVASTGGPIPPPPSNPIFTFPHPDSDRDRKAESYPFVGHGLLSINPRDSQQQQGEQGQMDVYQKGAVGVMHQRTSHPFNHLSVCPPPPLFDRNTVPFTPMPAVPPPSRPAPDPWRFKQHPSFTSPPFLAGMHHR